MKERVLDYKTYVTGGAKPRTPGYADSFCGKYVT